MLIEEGGVRVLTDPGTFTVDTHQELKNIDIILYTHEHYDHYHLDSLKTILRNNPDAAILCNPSVGALLDAEHIAHNVVGDGERSSTRDILIEGHGTAHAVVHASLPPMMNTGYRIATRLWYPGDAFGDPHGDVEILALPVAGPWMKLSDAIDYAVELKPQRCFPVHDGILNPAAAAGLSAKLPKMILEPLGVHYEALETGQVNEL